MEYIAERSKMIQKVVMAMKKKKINLECMPTEDAIAAYNYLVTEDRLVAACLIPPEEVTSMNSVDDDMSAYLAGSGGHDFGDTEGK